jgi:hypothetical protein
METKYLNYLRDDMKYLGFGDNALLNQQLEEHTERTVEGFELYTDAFFDEDTRLEAKLYFRHSDKENRYFFNKFDALLIYPEEPARNRAQTFYVFLGKGVTFKESFNLLQGRSAYKNMINLEGEKYKAWIRLDFGEKDLHDNYKIKQYGLRFGYELEKVLEKYPIRELQQEKTKAELYRSLQRGNRQSVTFDKATKSEKMYIEANPMFKTINIYPHVPHVVKGGTKKTGNEPLLPPIANVAENVAEDVAKDFGEQPAGVADTILAEATEEVHEDERAPEYVLVEKPPARKRVRK